MSKKLWSAYFVSLAVVVLAAMLWHTRPSNADRVYDACNRARHTGVLQECQNLEAKYNVEYLCKENFCWTEVKA